MITVLPSPWILKNSLSNHEVVCIHVCVIYIYREIYISIYYIFESEFGISAFMAFEFFSTAIWRLKTEVKIKTRIKLGFLHTHIMLPEAEMWKNSAYTTKSGSAIIGYLAITLFYCILQRERCYQLFFIMVKCLSGCFRTPITLCVFDISLLQMNICTVAVGTTCGLP